MIVVFGNLLIRLAILERSNLLKPTMILESLDLTDL